LGFIRTLRIYWVILGLATCGWSLDGMHDIRYNLKPEILTPEQSEVSGGFQSRWKADGQFIGAVKFGINDRFEVGSKLTFDTENRFGDMYMLLDLGMKFAINSGTTLQTDALFGINNNRGGGLVLTYSKAATYTNRFSAIYEGRVGMFGSRIGIYDSVSSGNVAILEGGVYPQMHVADPLNLRVGLQASTSLRHPIDQFQIDLLPGMIINVRNNLQIFGECAVDIIGGFGSGLRLSLHVISHF